MPLKFIVFWRPTPEPHADYVERCWRLLPGSYDADQPPDRAEVARELLGRSSLNIRRPIDVYVVQVPDTKPLRFVPTTDWHLN